MKLRLLLSVAGMLLLARLASGAALAPDFAAPIDTRLTLKAATGGGLTATWSGRPQISPARSELIVMLTREGGSRQQVLKRSLTLKAGKTAQAAVALPALKPGTYQLASLATMGMAGLQYAKPDRVRFKVGADGSMREIAPAKRQTARQFADQFRPRLPQAKPRAALAQDLGGFRVSGQFHFTNKNFICSHTTQTVEMETTTNTLPLRSVKVQVCDIVSSASFYFVQVLGSTTTDDNGNFSLYVKSNDDGDGTGRDIVIRVLAENGDATVQDFSKTTHYLDVLTTVTYNGQPYYPPLDWPGGPMNVGNILFVEDASGPWNILDAVRQGADFVRARGAAAPKALVRWAKKNTDGGYYEPGTNRISLRGDDLAADEFDDAVILHEYGHLVADKLSVDKNPGGVHYYDQSSSRALAWSEGWASFFSCAVRNDPFMIDSYFSQLYGFIADLESFTDIFTFDYRRGDDVEICVAAALWDIYDSRNEYRDSISNGIAGIWKVFTDGFTDARPCTFRDFHDGWRRFRIPGLASVRNIMDSFGINYWGGLMVNSMQISGGASLATSRTVTLNNLVSGSPVEYMASESSIFAGGRWKKYSGAPVFKLSSGDGFKRIFFKVRDAKKKVSTVKFDIIELKEQYVVRPNDPGYVRQLPPGADFHWYRMPVGKKGRIKVSATPSASSALAMLIYRANDLTRPVWGAGGEEGAGSAPQINEIFSAGDYVVVIFLVDPTSAAGSGGSGNPGDPVYNGEKPETYTIRAIPYSFAISG